MTEPHNGFAYPAEAPHNQLKEHMNEKTRPALLEEINKRQEAMWALRHDLHRHPELGFEETRTAALVADKLSAAGLEVRTGVARTGVVGVLRGDLPGPTIGWRADMDALPLTEKLPLPFASVNEGAMHACGHDGHVAVAVTLAQMLAARRTTLPGTVVFLFQPAEEVFGGAREMIAAGALDDPLVDKVYGLHLTSLLPIGAIGITPGAAMASVDFIKMEVQGRGGHGAMPHMAVDPITAAAHMVVGLQDLITREMPPGTPAVVTLGEIHAGSAANIIPELAVMRGTLRTFSSEVRDQLLERLGVFTRRIGQAYRTEARFDLTETSCPTLINPPEEAGFVHRCIADTMGEAVIAPPQPITASDDMSLFLRERPGCYFFVGAAPADKPPMPHHHPAFEMDDRGLAVALDAALTVLLTALAG